MRVKTDQAKIRLLYRAKWILLGCMLDILPGNGQLSARNTFNVDLDCFSVISVLQHLVFVGGSAEEERRVAFVSRVALAREVTAFLKCIFII